MQLGQTNAELAAAVGMVLMGPTLQLTGLAAETIKKVSTHADAQFTEECPFGGSADYVFSDADEDGTPSAGDTIHVTYTTCLVSLFQQTGSGTFALTLDQPSEPSTTEDRFFSGTMDARSLLQELTSTFDFDLHFGLLEETHRASGNVTYQLDIDGAIFTERLFGLDAVKHANFETARNEISAVGTVNSEILNGSVEFDGSTALSGFLNTYPEQGRIELQGAGSSRVAVVPYNVPNSTHATIEVDEVGNGSFVELTERPFWTSLLPDFTWSYAPTGQQFIRPFDENDFWFAGGSSVRGDIISVNSSLRLQFSRELDDTSVPGTVEIMRTFDEPPFIEQYAVATDVRGAAVVLRPLQQLRHGSQYTYPVDGLNVRDRAGNSVQACCAEFSTTDNLFAIAKASPVFGIAGVSVSLDGTQSASTGGLIASWSWEQINGPVGTISGADQATASFAVPAVDAPSILTLQLQVANGNGELEWDIAEVHAFGSPADVGLLYFYGETAEEISLGREWLMSNASNTMTVERDFYNGIWVSFQTWNVFFVAPGDATIEEGSYENAVRYQTIGSDNPELSLGGDGRGCNTSTGRFDVLDVVYDTNGDVLTAAIDFEQACDETGKILTGFLRIGSSIPVPPAP